MMSSICHIYNKYSAILFFLNSCATNINFELLTFELYALPSSD
jgi:hypothetical protein